MERSTLLSDLDRLEAVRQYRTVWNEAQAVLTRAASLAARALQVPFSYVTLASSRSFRVVGTHGIELSGSKQPLPELLELVFARQFTQSNDPATLTDLARILAQCLEKRKPLRPGMLPSLEHNEHIRLQFHAGVPLMNSDGHVLGNLAVIGDRARKLGMNEVAILEDLAEGLVSELGAFIKLWEWRSVKPSQPQGATANLLAIIESANEAIISETLEGTIMSWNAAAERLFGYTAREVLGRNITLIIPGGNENNVRAHLARIADGERIEPFETHRLHRNGGEVPVRVSMSPVFGRNGIVIGASSFSSDISDERHTRTVLYQTTAHLKTVVTQLPILFFAVDAFGMYTLAEGQGYNALGIQPIALLGLSSFETFRGHDNVIQALQRALNGEHTKIEVDFRGRHFKSQFSPLLEAGTVVGATAIALDITESKRDESHLHLLRSSIDGLSDGVLITDALLERPGPNIVYANPAFCAMTGYSLPELIDRSPRMFQGADTDESVLDVLRLALREGRSFDDETINYRKDGSSFEVLWHIAPIRDASGKITHYSSTQRDVTERNRVALLLRELAFMTGGTSPAGTFELPLEISDYVLPIPLEDLEQGLENLRPPSGSSADLHGELAEVGGAATLLQMLTLVRPTGLMRIERNGLYLRAGRIVHVEHKQLTGQAAVLEILALECGLFEFQANIMPKKPTLDLDITAMALEVARRIDEARVHC